MKALISWIQGRRRVRNELLKSWRRRRREVRNFEQLESRELLAFDIVISAGAGLAANADALGAFERAAQAWEAHIDDDITITIDADLANLGNPNVIGQTGSVLLQAGYDTIRNQMVVDAADEADDAIVASLPTAASATFLLPTGFGLSGLAIGSKAALKAAGFTGLDQQFGVSDAEITFNSQFQFDYDNSDGVTANTMDLETVAIHEIGHAVGFISEVDSVDYISAFGSPTSIAPAMLDLFRFENNTANDPSDAISFTSAARSLVPGTDGITEDNSNIATVTISSKGGGGGKPGGGGNGGGRGGKPNIVASFSPSSLARTSVSFGIHELPAGMEGDLDMNAAGDVTTVAYAGIVHVPSATNPIPSQSADRLFGGAMQTEGALAGARHATKQSDVVAYQQTTPVENALLALDAATQLSKSDVVDYVMAELADTPMLPFSTEFWQLPEVDDMATGV